MTHTYAVAGTYTVTLTVTDTGGATASTSQQVVASRDLPRLAIMGVTRQAFYGVPGWSVAAVDAAGGTVATLVEEAPKRDDGSDLTGPCSSRRPPRTPSRRSRSRRCCRGQPSTGQLLAVAQNGARTRRALALTGRFPPGSTFKIVTALAGSSRPGLGGHPGGLPGRTVIGGRPVPNAERSTSEPCRPAGVRPFLQHDVRHRRCRAGTGRADHRGTAACGADYAVPTLTTIAGAVPAAPDLVQRAEGAFGQGQVLASPLGAALVGDRRARRARGAATGRRATDRGPHRSHHTRPGSAGAGAHDDARGRHRGHRDGPERPGRCAANGTAEFTNDGTRAHGWFVGYRGDLAFAVLVVDGGSSEPAVAAAGRFLGAVPR